MVVVAASASEIAEELKHVLYDKMKDDCMKEMINNTVDDAAATFGLIDAAMSSLLVIYPSDQENMKVRSFVSALMGQWRQMGLSSTLKAHVMEHHICNFNDEHSMVIKMKVLLSCSIKMVLWMKG